MSLIVRCLDENRFPSTDELATLYAQEHISPRRGAFLRRSPGTMALCGCPVGVLMWDHIGSNGKSLLYLCELDYARDPLLGIVRERSSIFTTRRWDTWVSGVIGGFDNAVRPLPDETMPEDWSPSQREGFRTGAELRLRLLPAAVQP